MKSTYIAGTQRGLYFVVLCATLAITVSALLIELHPADGPIIALVIIPATLFAVDFACLVIALVAPYPLRSDKHHLLQPPWHPASEQLTVPVIVPLLVRSQADIDAAERCLRENRGLMYERVPHIILLIDFCDSASPVHQADASLRRSLEAMMQSVMGVPLCADSAEASALFRERRWNPYEGKWMGWERKRGKVVEFLMHSRGEATSFEGDCPTPWRNVEFVFVMDVDSRLVGKDLDLLVDEFVRRRAREVMRPSVISPVVRTLDQRREPIERWLYEPWACTGGRDWRRRTLRDQAFGKDIYNGKALIAVDEFLSSCKGIAVNTILSHDHLEAILGHGCSTPVASVHEPFPPSRKSWERRQHRWMRGDFQLLPWVFTRRPYRTSQSLTFGMRAAVAHVIIDALAPIALYILMITGLIANWRSGTLFGIILLLIHRSGMVLAIARVPLFVSDRSSSSWKTLCFLCANAALRTLGVLIYLQRDALITADALRLTVGRLLRHSRRGLLEWYPSDADRPVRTRSLFELLLMAGAVLLWASELINGVVIVAIVGWLTAPVLLGMISVTRSRLDKPRF